MKYDKPELLSKVRHVNLVYFPLIQVIGVLLFLVLHRKMSLQVDVSLINVIFFIKGKHNPVFRGVPISADS